MTVNTDGATPVRPAIGWVFGAARLFGGTVHGDDADGVVDIEWSAGHINDALDFAARCAMNGWAVELRDPVRSLASPVVLQVEARPRDAAASVERDRYPASMMAPQPIDESLPRNCEVCGTVDWWAQSGSKSTVEGRRQEWHDAKHPRPFEGWTARAARPAGLSRPAVAPAHYTSPSAVIACGAPIFEETVFSPERSGVTCSGCRAAIDVMEDDERGELHRNRFAASTSRPEPERGSAAYNSALLNEWGI